MKSVFIVYKNITITLLILIVSMRSVVADDTVNEDLFVSELPVELRIMAINDAKWFFKHNLHLPYFKSILSKNNFPSDTSELDAILDDEMEILGVVKPYEPTNGHHNTIRTNRITDETDVMKFVEWVDSSLTVFVGIDSKPVQVNTYRKIDGSWFPSYYENEKNFRPFVEVVKAWPQSKGYQPVFVWIPHIKSKYWYFHIPEVDAKNFTPMVTNMVDTVRSFTNLSYSKKVFADKRIQEHINHCILAKRKSTENIRKRNNKMKY